jgi:hypothetical protein
LFHIRSQTSANRNEAFEPAGEIPLVHKGFTASIEVTS